MSILATLLDSAAASQGFEVLVEAGQPVVVTTPRGPSPLGELVSEDQMFSLLTEVLSDDQQAELAVGNPVAFDVECGAGRWNLQAEPGAEGISVQGRLQGQGAGSSEASPALDLPPLDAFAEPADPAEPAPAADPYDDDGLPPPPDVGPPPALGAPPAVAAPPPVGMPSAPAPPRIGAPPSVGAAAAKPADPEPIKSTLQFRFDAAPDTPGPDGSGAWLEPDDLEELDESEVAPGAAEIGAAALDLDGVGSLDLGAPDEGFPAPPAPPDDLEPPPEPPPPEYGSDLGTGESGGGAVFVDPDPPIPSVADGLRSDEPPDPDAGTHKDLGAVGRPEPGLEVRGADQLDEIGGSLPPATLCFVLGEGVADHLAASIGGMAIHVHEGVTPGSLGRQDEVDPGELTVVVTCEDPSRYLGWLLRRLEEGSRVLIETRATTAAGARRVLLGVASNDRAEAWLDAHEQVALTWGKDEWVLRPL